MSISIRDTSVTDEKLYNLLKASLGTMLTESEKPHERGGAHPLVDTSLLYSLEKGDLIRLIGVCETLTTTRSLHVALRGLIKEITDILGASRCSLLFVDRQREKGTIALSHEGTRYEGAVLSLEHYPEIRHSVETGEITIIKDPLSDPIMSALGREALRGARAHSILVLPLFFRGQVFGVLHIRRPVAKQGFTIREVRICKLMADIGMAAFQRICTDSEQAICRSAVSMEARGSISPSDFSPLAPEVCDGLPIGLLLVDQRRSIIYANREMERITGIAREQLLHMQFQEIVPDHVIEDIRSMRRSHTPEAGTMDKYHIPLVSRGGVQLHVSIEVRTLPGVRGVQIVSFRDVTREKSLSQELQERNCELVSINNALTMTRQELLERNEELHQANQRLEELHKLKTNFMAVAIHEIRTPLNVILGYSQLLLSEKLGPLSREQKRVLVESDKNCERLLDIVNDVLDLSKIEAGKMDISPREANIVELVQRVYRQMKIISDRSHLRLTLKVPRKPIIASFDPDRIEQVLMNLISNAIKFTPENGRIELSVAPVAKGTAGRCVRIAVSDTGRGLPKEMLDKVFDEFHQISPQGIPLEKRGSGLGLAISKKIIERHGGTIWAESEEGKGSTFSFTLPLTSTSRSRREQTIHEKARASGR